MAADVTSERQTALAPQVVDPAFLTLHEEIRTNWRYIDRALRDMVDAFIRLATALQRMLDSQLYAPYYPTFEAYLNDCHRGLDPKTARRYITLLDKLGEPLCRTVIEHGVGMERAELLAEIQRLDPDALAELLALPPVEGRLAVATIAPHELQQRLRELEERQTEALLVSEELRRQVVAAESIARTKGARLDEVVVANRQFVSERDQAVRRAEEAESAQQQLRAQVGRLERELRAEQQSRTRAPLPAPSDRTRELEARINELTRELEALRQAPAPEPVIVERVVEVEKIVTPPAELARDPRLAARLAASCVETLRLVPSLNAALGADAQRALREAIADRVRGGDEQLLSAALLACADSLDRHGASSLPPAVLRDLERAGSRVAQTLMRLMDRGGPHGRA